MSDLLEIPLLTEDFDKIIQSNSYYVDKTSFIKNLESENVALFTRPRRFGKTLAMSMVKNFLEMNYDNPSDISKPQELFKDLAISKDTAFCQKHMGQYPVISLTFKNINGESIEEAAFKVGECFKDNLLGICDILSSNSNLSSYAKEDIDIYKRNIIKLANKEIRHSIASDLQDLTSILLSLSHYLYMAFKRKAIIILDEYDKPLANARGKYYQEFVKFLDPLLNETFKGNQYLWIGYLTGCLHIPRQGITTGFNNVQIFDCSGIEYEDLFGFTNEDVIQILRDYNLSDKFDIFKEWYGGYQIHNVEIYNPYSVLSYVDTLIKDSGAKPVNSLLNAEDNDFLIEFIKYIPDRELCDLKKLLDGGTVEKSIDVRLNYDDLDYHYVTKRLWTMLYLSGYLTKVGKNNDGTYTLKIPNKEVKEFFKEKIVSYFSESTEHHNNVQELIHSLVSQKDYTVSEIINTILPKYIVLCDAKENLEYTYHSFMECLLASTELKIGSQKESRDGYPDISFTMINPETGELVGVILELKIEPINDLNTIIDKSKEVLKECKEKQYYRSYLGRSDIDRIYMYGIAFCNSRCSVVTEEVPKE